MYHRELKRAHGDRGFFLLSFGEGEQDEDGGGVADWCEVD